MKHFLNDVVDDAHEHSVEAEDDYRTDWDVDDDLGFEFVCAAPKVDDGEDREETNNEIEGDMNDDITLIDVPIKKYEAKGKSWDANEKGSFEVSFFHIVGLT